MIKKIIFTFLFLLFNTLSVHAIDSDNIINSSFSISTLSTQTYTIPTWYDFYLTNLSYSSTWSTDLSFSDSWSLIIQRNSLESESLSLIFRETFSVYNWTLWTIWVFYSWYLVETWIDIATWIDSDVSKNWNVKQEYEFLRQNELYNFYSMELTLLLLLTIIIVLQKFTFSKRKII